jgi:hypothetical protein
LFFGFVLVSNTCSHRDTHTQREREQKIEEDESQRRQGARERERENRKHHRWRRKATTPNIRLQRVLVPITKFQNEVERRKRKKRRK